MASNKLIIPEVQTPLSLTLDYPPSSTYSGCFTTTVLSFICLGGVVLTRKCTDRQWDSYIPPQNFVCMGIKGSSNIICTRMSSNIPAFPKTEKVALTLSVHECQVISQPLLKQKR